MFHSAYTIIDFYFVNCRLFKLEQISNYCVLLSSTSMQPAAGIHEALPS